jgi:putative FmdB family regulatory protein
MPLYEYTCQECDHSFEALVQSGEQVECPECESPKVHRLLSLPAAPRVNPGSGPSPGCDPGLPPCGPGCCQL